LAGVGKPRIVILGGGFGGVFTAKHLQRRAGGSIDIQLISRNNFFVFQPLLPEVAGGNVHPMDAVSPLRLFLKNTTIRVADVRKVELSARTVHVTAGRDRAVAEVPYDHLVIALGQVVDLRKTPGLSERALVMKDVADAFSIRNQILGCLEEADEASDPRRKRRLLTFVAIGGGFTGVETVGEVQDLIRKTICHYPRIRPEEVRIILIQHGARILPELPEHLAAYAADALRRRGVEILLKTGVKAVGAAGIETDGGHVFDAETIIAAIGNAAAPLVRSMQVPLQKGRIVVDRCLRVDGFENVWALGDNALIPLGNAEEGETEYAPPLAQFAFREAKVLAANILSSIAGRPPAPFAYESLGTMASLGGRRGVADIMGVRIAGFPAWLAWKILYLSLLPGMSNRVRYAIDGLLNLVFSRGIAQVRPSGVASHPIRLLAGDVVLEPGFKPEGLYVVTSGSFELSRPTPGEGEEGYPSESLGPGDRFGLLPNGEAPEEPQRVRACEDASAYFIAREDLQRLTMVAALLQRRSRMSAAGEPEHT
jgi:NADH dehydrogenase